LAIEKWHGPDGAASGADHPLFQVLIGHPKIDITDEIVAEVHNRMPLLLEENDFETWLTGNGDEVRALMRPAPNDVLRRWPVSKLVNSSPADNADATLIEPFIQPQLHSVDA
jgi:hypothetical protein